MMQFEIDIDYYGDLAESAAIGQYIAVIKLEIDCGDGGYGRDVDEKVFSTLGKALAWAKKQQQNLSAWDFIKVEHDVTEKEKQARQFNARPSWDTRGPKSAKIGFTIFQKTGRRKNHGMKSCYCHFFGRH